jgi:hypothetical protein
VLNPGAFKLGRLISTLVQLHLGSSAQHGVELINLSLGLVERPLGVAAQVDPFEIKF